MPSTDKLPTGQWRSRVYIGNGKTKSFYAKTKKEAEQKSYEYLVKNPIINNGDYSDITLEQAFNLYLSAKSNVLSPSTINGYTKLARFHYTSLKPCKITKITNPQIQECLNTECAELSPKTMSNMLGLLTAVFGILKHKIVTVM